MLTALIFSINGHDISLKTEENYSFNFSEISITGNHKYASLSFNAPLILKEFS